MEQTLNILEGIRSTYESHHGVLVSPEAIAAAARWSHRYIHDRFLPDKAIDLIDEAGSLVQLRYDSQLDAAAAAEDPSTVDLVKPVVMPTDIASVLSKWSGVPVERMTEDEAGRLLRLEETLAERIIGQSEAVSALGRAVRRARAGLTNEQRPIASLYFAGPTGVGKTELCKVLASEYYADAKALIRLDMSEYSEQHSVSRLVGPPPGYVGFDDPRSGQLTEAVRRRPYSVVVLDEIEKAHADVFNLLLQVLEDGRLTDGKGRTVSFSNTIIVMTSNVGSREILASGADYATMRSAVQAQLQKRYKPEFLNRIDELLIFRGLGEAELREIVRLTLGDAAARAAEADRETRVLAGGGAASGSSEMLQVRWSQALEDEVVSRGADTAYGARPLRRAVQRLFEDPLAEVLVGGRLTAVGGEAVVDFQGGEVSVRQGGDVFRVQLSAVGQDSGSEQKDAAAQASAGSSPAPSGQPTAVAVS